MSLIWHFSQSWLPECEPGFQPALARIDRLGGQIQLVAEMNAESVKTTASANQQRLWEHGDVLEVFIQGKGSDDYREYQISPNGFTLSLHYPGISSVRAMREGSRRIEEFFTEGPEDAAAFITPTGWLAILLIALPIQKEGEIDTIRLSCSRYDYGSGRPPVLSSTSPHTVRDFHRPEDWREIFLMEE